MSGGRNGSASSPMDVENLPTSPHRAGDLLNEDDEELEMHSKAFYTIQELKAMRAKAAEDRRRCGRVRIRRRSRHIGVLGLGLEMRSFWTPRSYEPS